MAPANRDLTVGPRSQLAAPPRMTGRPRELVYFDDIEEGVILGSYNGRTVSEADVATFAGLSGDLDALHVDEEWARNEGPFGSRVAHGLLVTSIASGFPGPWDDWAYIAFLGLSRQFGAPVCLGDTIRLDVTVVEKRHSRSKPDRGVITTEVQVLNADGDVVQSGQDSHMVMSRTDASD